MSEILLELEQKVRPAHTAVLVVDVQNDFCAPGGYWDTTGTDIQPVQRMVQRLVRFLDAARRAGVHVIFIQAIYDEPYRSPVQKERHIRRFGSVLETCQSGTWGAEFYEVKPAAGEIVVRKHRYSAFHGTELDLVLRSQGIRTLVLTGVATNVCVESTAREGFMRDHYVVLVDDCTAARTEAFHRSAVANIEAFFGVVVPAEALARCWNVSS